MADSEVVPLDDDIDSGGQESATRRRIRWVLSAVIVILILLLFSCSAISTVWLSGGEERARFMARNIACLQCHTEKIPDFARPVVHNPFARHECTSCHTPHGAKVSVSVVREPREWFSRYRRAIQWLPFKWWFALNGSDSTEVESQGSSAVIARNSTQVKGPKSGLVMPEKLLCLACHGSMGAKLGEAYTHEPFSDGACVKCHDPHASDFTGLLTKSPEELCFKCHDMGMELARSQTHPPAVEGDCVRCHDPHASEYVGMTVTSQRELCFECHPSVAGLDVMAVQHVPFINGECTGCHQPHGSDYEPLLDAVQPDLCYECHPGIEDQFAQPSHHPVGVTMECGSCHDPHAAQYEALLAASDNSFCYQCHGAVKVTYDQSKHERTLCVQCHSPHGSGWEPMLRERNPSLCLTCHDAMHFDERASVTYRNNHPVQPTHYDPNAGAALTCSSSCHDPHGTKHTNMLRFFDYPEDGNCLMCHAITRGSRVGIDY